ncbi:MAG TPA: flavin reductase family protein [Candidatus Dorea intestinavium]|nr:flavin reductase family protein [Candidatus Dorea intestinavium]
MINEKENWKPGNMIYPLPAVMVSCAGKDKKANIITIGWTGTICTNPPMCYISVRPERYSHHLINETKEFVINLTTKDLAKACDYCGVKSGKYEDKFEKTKLHKGEAKELNYAPIINESPVNIECKVKEVKKLGSHHMFIADVVNVQVNKEALNDKGKFELNKTGLITYSHGEYFLLGKSLGTFGYSVKKKKKRK